jgi:cyclase
MDRDGTQDGYDTALLQAISGAVDVPVIASGGAGEPHHLVDGVQAGADAVLCASIFHYGRYSIAQVKDALAEAGIAVRPLTG